MKSSKKKKIEINLKTYLIVIILITEYNLFNINNKFT